MVEHMEHWDGYATEELPPESVLFGRSPGMQEVKTKLFRACTTSVPLLLQGEAGVGKALLSRFVHERLYADKGRYLCVNCAALTDVWAPVAFSLALKNGAAGDGCRPERCSVATLFLDRVCELSARSQRMLAQLMADQEELAASGKRGGPLQIIAATNHELRQEVKKGRFRRDLFDFLAVVTIRMPPLRRRREDLAEMSEYLRLRWCAKLGAVGEDFPPDVMRRMLLYRWPGNICELESFIGRFVSLGAANCGPVEASAGDPSNRAGGSDDNPSEGGHIWKN